MKRILLFFFATLILSGCVKDDDDAQLTTDEFVGTYDLQITYNSYIDGEAEEAGNTMTGTLTITQEENPEIVDVTGIVTLKGQEVGIYQTLGSLNNKGELELQPSTFIIESSGLACNITYGTIASGDPLRFDSELNAAIGANTLTYKMKNTATLK